MKDTITIGGHTFMRNAKLLVNTLFTPGGTAAGLFKKRSNGVLFSKPSGKPFAFLVANKYGERFFVSCSASVPDGGKIRYQFGLSSLDRELLGLPERYLAQSEEACRIWEGFAA